MDHDIKEMFELVLNGIHGLESQNAEMRSDIAEMKGDIVEMRGDITDMKGDIAKLNKDVSEVKGGLLRVQIQIENEVTKKIESLFDGYQLVHERQWEMQKQIDAVLRRLDRLEALQPLE